MAGVGFLDQLGDDYDLIVSRVPFASAMGLKVVKLAPSEASLSIPYSKKLVGDPDTGIVHGGVITALLDHAAGMAVMCALEEPEPFATLDLRIDYNHPATPGQDIIAHAHCYKMTRSVAFVRANAFHSDPDDPIANAVGAFMLASNRVGSVLQAASMDQQSFDKETAKTAGSGAPAANAKARPSS
jgi:uncharacterized protein (TIGR00369 family)